MIFLKSNPALQPLSPKEKGKGEGISVINQTKRTILAENALTAANPFSRLRGLLGKANLARGSGLLLKPCNSIHTFFMRFAIDAVFVNKQNQIIKIYSQLRPWRLSAIFLNSAFCLELPAGILTATQTQEGDTIKIEYLIDEAKPR